MLFVYLLVKILVYLPPLPLTSLALIDLRAS